MTKYKKAKQSPTICSSEDPLSLLLHIIKTSPPKTHLLLNKLKIHKIYAIHECE